MPQPLAPCPDRGLSRYRLVVAALAALAALVIPLTTSASEGSVAKAPSAEAAVRALVAEQVSAWNRGDLDAFCAGYAEDALFVSPSGLTEGREEVLARYRKRYPDRAAMGTLAIEILEVRTMGESGGEPSGVVAVGKWSLGYPDKEEASGHTLLVFRPRPGGGWEIAEDASM
ncbi:MAG: nuclear transport factor 2 family protein [Acidobacteria bacterium]|nr:nuclear transport factor 2 family protein [Acidobacteriota bacterium]